MENNYPGIKPEPFFIHFSTGYFKKGDIISSANNSILKVIKVYKYNWWRKLLNFFGIRFKLVNVIKVIEYGK